jgi:hypothetical protein
MLPLATSEKLFNSIYRKGEAENQNNIQFWHFIGWFIKSKEVATLWISG